MSSADRKCVELCLNGHPEAYGKLVERYQAPLLSFLIGRLGDEDRAEEVSQEAFVRSYFKLKKLKKPDSFFSWLIGIATRVAKEQRRARRHAEIPDSIAGRSPTPSPSLDQNLKRAVAELAKPYRDVILLRYYGGLSCAEVAEWLGMPLGTATKTLSRAYAMLRESLGGEVKP